MKTESSQTQLTIPQTEHSVPQGANYEESGPAEATPELRETQTKRQVPPRRSRRLSKDGVSPQGNQTSKDKVFCSEWRSWWSPRTRSGGHPKHSETAEGLKGDQPWDSCSKGFRDGVFTSKGELISFGNPFEAYFYNSGIAEICFIINCNILEHTGLEIICWYGAQETFSVIINVKNSCAT